MDKLKFENWLFMLGDQYNLEDQPIYIKGDLFSYRVNWFELIIELCNLESKLQDQIFKSAIKIIRHGGTRLQLVNFFTNMAHAYVVDRKQVS